MHPTVVPNYSHDQEARHGVWHAGTHGRSLLSNTDLRNAFTVQTPESPSLHRELLDRGERHEREQPTPVGPPFAIRDQGTPHLRARNERLGVRAPTYTTEELAGIIHLFRGYFDTVQMTDRQEDIIGNLFTPAANQVNPNRPGIFERMGR